MTTDLSRHIDNKITEQDFKRIMESLNHIFIHFMEIPNGIDIMWDMSYFFHMVHHIGIEHIIPDALIKLIVTKSHDDKATCYGIKDRPITMFDAPQAYFELKHWFITNKYYFTEIENYSDGH